MRTPTILATAVVAAAAAAAGASAETTAFRVCPPAPIAGRSWTIVTLGVPCSKASGLVRRLAGAPRPASRLYPGTYDGMRCLNASDADGRAFTCLSGDAQRQVRANLR